MQAIFHLEKEWKCYPDPRQKEAWRSPYQNPQISAQLQISLVAPTIDSMAPATASRISGADSHISPFLTLQTSKTHFFLFQKLPWIPQKLLHFSSIHHTIYLSNFHFNFHHLLVNATPTIWFRYTYYMVSNNTILAQSYFHNTSTISFSQFKQFLSFSSIQATLSLSFIIKIFS